MREEEEEREKKNERSQWGRWARAQACHALSVRRMLFLDPAKKPNLEYFELF